MSPVPRRSLLVSALACTTLVAPLSSTAEETGWAPGTSGLIDNHPRTMGMMPDVRLPLEALRRSAGGGAPLLPIQSRLTERPTVTPALALLDATCSGTDCAVVACQRHKERKGSVCEDGQFYQWVPDSFQDRKVYGVSAVRAANGFYRLHPDSESSGWDEVIFFTTFHTSTSVVMSAYYQPVRNEVKGIIRTFAGERGLPEERFNFNHPQGTGSNGHLKGLVLMSDWHECTIADFYGYGCDDGPPYSGNQSRVLGVLAQEVGHRYGAFVRAGKDHDKIILGRDDSHWSWFADSGGSPLEGNDWELSSPGKWKRVAVEKVRFSPLDLYLMGVLPPEEVPELEVIDPNGGTAKPGDPPGFGPLTVSGSVRRIGIDEIIASEGAREPAFPKAPRVMHAAFVLLENADARASEAEQRRVDTLRREFTRAFYEGTDRRMRFVSTISRRDDLPLYDFVLDEEGWELAGRGSTWRDGSLVLPMVGEGAVSRADVEVDTSRYGHLLLDVTSSQDAVAMLRVRWADDDAGTDGEVVVQLPATGRPSRLTVPLTGLPGWTGTATRWQLLVEPGEKTTAGQVSIHAFEVAEQGLEDVDDDRVADAFDNCVGLDNPGQEDWNRNGVGDGCPLPNGGVDGAGCGCDAAAAPGSALLLAAGALLRRRRR